MQEDFAHSREYADFLKERGFGENISENVAFLQLWDMYKGLLTQRQQQVTDLFFNYDLSLSEIASEIGVSRQSVSECINTVKRQLKEYEEKLGHFCAMERLLLDQSEMLTKVSSWIERMRGEHPELCEELDSLEGALPPAEEV
ncbi:MAG: sigma factor-like helix-turn-helix DNA-binding protein [Christensenellaceae bacterium]